MLPYKRSAAGAPASLAYQMIIGSIHGDYSERETPHYRKRHHRPAINHAGLRNDRPHFFEDATLSAGLLDIHMHGAIGHDVMEGTTDALRTISKFLAQHGVTEYL